MKLTKFAAGQCRITENDGKGLVICDESAVVSLNDCILETADSKEEQEEKLEYASLFPPIAGAQRQKALAVDSSQSPAVGNLIFENDLHQ